MKSKNWFEQGGRNYAKFRPEYPSELASYLASISLDTSLAVDIGCGNGQLTNLLAEHFSAVISIDPSQEQLIHAKPNWSAVKKAQKADRTDILNMFAADISNLWGNPKAKHPISWPIKLRIGRI